MKETRLISFMGFSFFYFIYKVLVSLALKIKLHKIEILRRIHNLFLLMFPVKIYGYRFYLIRKINDYTPFSYWEPYESLSVQIVKENVKKGDFAVDIGAHIGIYTLLLANCVGEEGKVFAFEPEENNFYLLKKNIALNGFRNIKVYKKAVGASNKKVKLYVSEESSFQHSIYFSSQANKNQNVSMIKLDNFEKIFLNKLKFIKIDIQGGELLALEGMRKIVKTNKDLKLLIEYWPYGQLSYCKDACKMIFWLLKHHFKIYDIDEKRKKIEETSLSRLIKKYPPLIGNYTNLFCIKY